MARAVQGDGLGERISHREPGGEQDAAAAGGGAGSDANRREFAKLIWETASPRWNFDDATFERSATAFDNPDHVAIAIDNYRWRLGLTPGEATFDQIEAQLAAF